MLKSTIRCEINIISQAVSYVDNSMAKIVVPNAGFTRQQI